MVPYDRAQRAAIREALLHGPLQTAVLAGQVPAIDGAPLTEIILDLIEQLDALEPAPATGITVELTPAMLPPDAEPGIDGDRFQRHLQAAVDQLSRLIVLWYGEQDRGDEHRGKG